MLSLLTFSSFHLLDNVKSLHFLPIFAVWWHYEVRIGQTHEQKYCVSFPNQSISLLVDDL